MHFKINRKGAFALIILALLLVTLNIRWFWHFFYPIDNKAYIFKYAQEYNVDPYLIASIIKTESKFNPKAESAQGARGLMQIMPETGKWAARQMKVSDFNLAKLYEPETNIRIGTWYIANLKHEFGEDMILALASYNGGRSNVKQWLEQDKWTGEHATIDQIPYPETRKYVHRVIEDYKKYRWIYLD